MTTRRDHRGLNTTNTKQLFLAYTANVTRATRASPVYTTRAHSLRTGRREGKMRMRTPG